MDKIRLKVCGLRDNIEEVIALGPDYAGFIFYEKTPRYVGDDFIMPELSKEIKKVGVFVNDALEKVRQFVGTFELDYAQLHGNESPHYCEQLNKAGIRIIKAFQMEEGFDFEQLNKYEPSTDYFLFDTKTSSYGGSGEVFNWDLLKKYDMKKEYFLSGGISMNNIGQLADIDLSKVHALDVNSRFEIKPGLKDVALLKELIKKI